MGRFLPQGFQIVVGDEDHYDGAIWEGRPFPTRLGAGDIYNDAWGVPKVSFPRSMWHGMFTFEVSQRVWFTYHNGVQVYTSTNITSTNNAGVMSADATNHTLRLEARECPAYQPNRGVLFSTSIIAPNKIAGAVRQWGLCTAENGVVFRLKSDGRLYAVRKSGGVQKAEELIDTSTVPNFDAEKGNIYDIQYQWRGVGSYFFYINNVKVHAFNLLGTLTELSTENPALPACFEVQRITDDVSMTIGCADITSENGKTDVEEYNSAYCENVSVSGTDVPTIILKVPLQVNGETNTRTMTLARISFTCSKKGVFKVWQTRNPALITGATFKPIPSSFVECDSPSMDATAVRATAVTTTNMEKITAVPVEAAVSRQVDNPYRGRIEFPLVRGDYLVVTCTATTATADVVVEIGEHL